MFALDSTKISLIINLLRGNEEKYFRGTIKIHTLLDFRGTIPLTFVHITDGKYHDNNVLDIIVPQPGAIFLMDRTYVVLPYLMIYMNLEYSSLQEQ